LIRFILDRLQQILERLWIQTQVEIAELKEEDMPMV